MKLEFSVERAGSGSDDSIALSSANVAISVSCVVGTGLQMTHPVAAI